MKRYPYSRIPSLRFTAVAIIAMVIFAGITERCQAQSIDSLRMEILSLHVNQKNIQINLAMHQKQFSKGTFFVIGGIATGAVGTILYDRQSANQDLDKNKKNPWLVYIGSALLTAGVVLQIDSHKYFRRAGQRVK